MKDQFHSSITQQRPLGVFFPFNICPMHGYLNDSLTLAKRLIKTNRKIGKNNVFLKIHVEFKINFTFYMQQFLQRSYLYKEIRSLNRYGSSFFDWKLMEWVNFQYPPSQVKFEAFIGEAAS